MFRSYRTISCLAKQTRCSNTTLSKVNARYFTEKAPAVAETEEVPKTKDGREIVKLDAKSGIDAVFMGLSLIDNEDNKSLDEYEERGVMYHTPKEELTKKIRIYQRPRNPCQTGFDNVQDYQVFADRGQCWQDPLTGWYVKSDQFMRDTGLQNLRFKTEERAMEFLKKSGYLDVIVEKSPKRFVAYEPQSYQDNFLNRHVTLRRSKMDKREFQEKQFKQKGRGKTCWVNLKHTQYGPKASKAVSGTQWSDPHPNNHTAAEWVTDSFEKLQDESRNKGKS